MNPASVLKTLPRIIAEKQKSGYSVLAAYFLSDRNAGKALWELEKNGLTRTAVLRRVSAGAVRVRDTFARLRSLLIVLFALLLAAAAGLLHSLLSRSAANPGISFPLWISVLAGAGLGAVLGWAVFRRSRYGIDRQVLAEHAQWLLAEESVLLLQAPLHAFRNPQIIIRESGETQPTIFLLFPPRKAEPAGDPGATALLPQAQLQQYARKLAQEHRLLEKPCPRRTAAAPGWEGRGLPPSNLPRPGGRQPPGTADHRLGRMDPRQRIHHRKQRPRHPRQPSPPVFPPTPAAGSRSVPEPAAHLRAGQRIRRPRRFAPGPGEPAVLPGILSIRPAADHRRTVGDAANAAHRADRRHPIAGGKNADGTAGTGDGGFLGQPADLGQPAGSRPAVLASWRS